MFIKIYFNNNFTHFYHKLGYNKLFKNIYVKINFLLYKIGLLYSTKILKVAIQNTDRKIKNEKIPIVVRSCDILQIIKGFLEVLC